MEYSEAFASFETSEMAATFLASTPLLRESWRRCAAVNSAAATGFLTEASECGGVGYVAFSGVKMAEYVAEPAWARLVALENAAVFGPLVGSADDGPPAMIHAGLLKLFSDMLCSADFLNQVREVKEKSKWIVITGHSFGGATASVTTLWLLSQLTQLSSSSSTLPSILCVTFGSPLIGNERLGRAILRERWAANFCHVAANHDPIPRLLSIPPAWPMLKTRPGNGFLAEQGTLAWEEFSRFVIETLEKSSSFSSEEERVSSLLWPFGNYVMCSEEGAICLDDASCVLKMMHLTCISGGISASRCFGDHFGYGEYVERLSWLYLQKRSFSGAGNPDEDGLALALKSVGIAPQDAVAKECLTMARRSGLTPILNCAALSISLSQVVPYRAQIEWYMASCDESDEKLGYYDEFKLNSASRKRNQVNWIRHKLAVFWDGVIEKLENNELPHDFEKRGKWVNALHFYKLLVEPLDIADYYRNQREISEGHYLAGDRRPRRYRISDRWWRDLRAGKSETGPRTRFASQTQDPCFWARLEEAREWLGRVRNEDGSANAEAWERVNAFDAYARSLVEKKEVSRDVVAENSSYMKWVEKLRELRSGF